MKIYHEQRRYDSNFKMWQKDYRDMRFLPHWHTETEWILVAEGNATILVGDRTYAAAAGDLIVCAGGCIHACVGFAGHNRLSFLMFDPHLASADSGQAACATYIPRKALEAAGLSKAVQQVFATAKRELAQKDVHHREILKGTLCACLFSLARAFPDTAPADTAKRQAQMQAMLVFAETHFREPLTLQTAAAAFHFSPAHFSRLFSRLAGMPFLQYVHTLRVEEAIRLLQKTELPVIDIALSCGFNTVRSFNRVFRAVTGSAPTSLRETGGILPPPPRKAYDAVPVENDSFVVVQ